MIVLAVFVTAALLGMLAIALLNARTLPHLGQAAHSPGSNQALRANALSFLIPARNEAANIGATVRQLLAQALPESEVIVLDDNSEDDTAALALAAAGGAANCRVLAGQPLPAGWMGKNWACQQLSLAAHGEILVFTDADVRWQAGAAHALVALMAQEQADLLTVWPTQLTVTWGERLVVPLMALAIVGYLPAPLAHHTPYPAAAAANGQCLAFRREAYTAIGGHAAVRNVIVEDIRLAQRIKAHGLRLRMADGASLIQCRMYDGWHATIDGYSKNILAGHGNSVFLLFISTIFHWAVFLGPWGWLLFGSAWPVAGWPWWPLALIAAGLTVRAITAAVTRQRVGDALLMPISVLIMTWIALRAVWWRWRHGGVRWKGRTIQYG